MKITYLFRIVCVLLLVGCTKSKTTEIVKNEITTHFDKTAIKKLYIDSIISIEKIVPLETSKNCLIQSIGELILTDNLFIILDNEQKKIFYFNKNDGSFIKQVGTKGKGPKEYMYISDIYFNRDENLLYAYDPNQSKMLIYNTKGDIVNAIKSKVNFFGFCKVDQSFWVWSCYTQKTTSEKYNLLKVSEDLKKIEEKFIPTENYFDRRYSMNPFVENGGEVYFIHGNNPQVYKINSDGVKPFYILDNLLGSTTYEELSSIKNKQIYQKKLYFSDKKYGRITGLTVSNKNIYFAFLKFTQRSTFNIGHIYNFSSAKSRFFKSISHKYLSFPTTPSAYYKNELAFVYNCPNLPDKVIMKVNEQYKLNLDKTQNPAIIITHEN